MALIKERVLRKATDDMGYLCGAGRGSPQLEVAGSNALFEEPSQEFLAMTQAFLDDDAPEMEICLKKLMSAGCAVDDVGGCTVLRHDRCVDSFCGRPILRGSGFSKVPRVCVESLEPSNKQVLLPPPIKVDRGAR